MDTPDSKTPSTVNKNNNKNKLINPCSSDSPAVQDSPVFNFISNLSPLQPVKAAPVAQGFPGLASPPLAFTSPRISLQTSFLSRQLHSSTSHSELSEENDKFQKSDGHPGDFNKVDLSLKIPNDENGCSRKDPVGVEHHNASGFLDGHWANPTKCTDTSNKRLFVDSPKSFEGGCSVQKDNNVVENKVADGSAPPKLTDSAQAQRRPNFKLVKLEPGRFISTSSKCSMILPKLSSSQTTSEVSQLECGSLRRCLFDGDQRKYMSELSDESGPQNPLDNLRNIQEVPKKNSLPGTVKGRQMINLSKPITSMRTSSPTARNNPVPIPKPLGIGLHLNSVVYPRSTEKTTCDQQSSEKILTVTGKTSVPVASDLSAEKISPTTDLIERVRACSEEIVKNEDSLIGASGTTLASDTSQNFEDPDPLKPDDSSAIMHGKRKSNAEHVETNKKLLGSPKKKRKKSSSSPDDDTPKHCNCKRSKCLKLYCDCFAAGLYCAETCACQGCFNRAENEVTVLETRKQIESRNPLAFAPKVVKLETNSPASVTELGNLSTPSSARHKRGCNCKRSMCLKNYCECYQSNVGCSDGCRCEGCQNVYGKREEHSFVREFMMEKVAETRGSELDDKEEGFSGSSDNLKSRLHRSSRVSPATPALLCSDRKKNAPKSHLNFRRFLRSQDPNHDMLPSEPSASCPGNPPSSSTSFEQTGTSVDGNISSSKPTDPKNVSSSLLRWRSSPRTPVSESSRSEYLQDFDSDNKQSDSHMLELEDDNDTPEILKDKANPTGSVHVRSPNKKRVSPPHYHPHKGSPNSLKICHKFVLQSVPQFPSLTPFSRKSSTGADASLD